MNALTSASTWLQRIGRRLVGPSASTSLRRIPILIALGVMVVSAPMFNRAQHAIVKSRIDGGWSNMRNEVQARLFAASAMLGGGPKVEDGLLFVVHPKERTQEALGQTDIEPPLFKLAESADSNLRDDWFTQQGRSFASFTRAYDGDSTLVALVDMGWWNPFTNGLRRGIWRWSVVGWLLTSLLAGLLSHLLLRPARRVLRERTDFLADAAHELRTPLAVIQASAGHALSRERGSGDYIRALTEIRSAAARAGSGVTEMLDLARFDAGQAVPRLAPLRLDLLAEELASSTLVDGCCVVAETGPNVLVQADMALIRQAIDNVVRNAAARSTSVRLRTYLHGTDGVLEVIDNGPGFAAEQLPYVFERYRRGDSRGSLGLGLPIAASIVAAHGGRIDVVSPVPSSAPDKPMNGHAVVDLNEADGENAGAIVLSSSVNGHGPELMSADGPGAIVTVLLPRARR
jgi:signal transduction histidine kinase